MSETNGNPPPLSLEHLDWRLRSAEAELEQQRSDLGLLSKVASSIVTLGEAMTEFRVRQDRIMQALGVSTDGPAPDITGQLRALKETDLELRKRDEELAASVEKSKQEGWHKVAAALVQVAKVGGALVGAVGVLSGSLYGLVQLLEKLGGSAGLGP